ncbi:lipopolysaccharide transport periplasmic protein LptA [Helicobacter sp.]|uniref:lipopolysaccharide transport periplasmic protein LptA n=1 Tax=Helicobacter sp. TaxID=218 RepID=UPI0025BC338F|nr:lipopolysaccharide transport periplasmic protein LptA [Helicobacter sp.]MCI5968506.1 lipopolysaccharide transport periplasmic protein LptA [Helicobacter sp.]MDY2584715.1 lipopolysaccharide transport periplasmic protein LptA [Helicobacter sp.]
MKYLIGILFLALFAFSEEIEVSAQEFVGDEKKKFTHLKGNVEIKRSSDRLVSNEAFVYLDSNNRPSKMQALGNVRFWFKLKDGRQIEGESNEALYLPNTQEYQILGNAIVRELNKKNVVRGDKIIVRQKDGYINVVGNEKKPARLIFKLDKEQ